MFLLKGEVDGWIELEEGCSFEWLIVIALFFNLLILCYSFYVYFVILGYMN